MTATFTWLDYSEADRRRALEVADLLREPSTVDELGLGVVRDAFANLLFPGTSTIQTRAAYFLFIPWQYRALERQRVSSKEVAGRARKAELELIDALAASEHDDGVIGVLARNTLKRLPSGVYWNGLRAWSIRRFPGSQQRYHEALDAFYASLAAPRDDDGNPVDGRAPTSWDPSLPTAPNGFPKGATFQLRPAEAAYLRERIIVSHRDSLLAFLVDRGKPTSVDFAWNHPQYAEFGPPYREQLDHARLFSEGMHGAQLLYNLMLAEARGNKEWLRLYQGRLEAWAARITPQTSSFARWDRVRFWAITAEGEAKVGRRTRDFIDSWIDLLINPGAEAVGGSPEARRRVATREQQLKGPRARLQNRQALLIWGGDAGSGQLDFRWPVTQTIVNDILRGTEPGA